MKTLKRRMMLASAIAVVAMPFAMAHPAGADTAPDLACGSTQPGPCTETAHFTQVNDTGTPLPPTAGCPDFVSTDFVSMVGTGNGVEHITVNKAQDAWFTSTFTGSVTLTAYPPSSVSVSDDGVVTIIGPPDASVPTFTGHLTEWFGGSFNKQSAVQHDTFNISATASNGQRLGVHVVDHASWTPGTDLNGPPHTAFDKVSCS